jgi:hypothetical protein
MDRACGEGDAVSYHCALGPGILPGGAPRSPHIRCDLCGVEMAITGPMPEWLLDSKAPRGWLTRWAGVRRVDACPECVARGVTP